MTIAIGDDVAGDPCAARGALTGSTAADSGSSSDLELVRRVLDNDRKARDQLCQRLECVPRVVQRLLGRSLGRPSPHDVEDLAQDVRTAIWRSLPRFDGRCRIETWVFGFCRNHALRWGQRRRTALLLEDTDFEPHEDDSAATSESSSGVDEVLRRLDRSLRVIVLLKHHRDLTFEAIGARLGISTNTVKTRYYRALGELRARLTADGDAPARVRASA